MAKTSRGKIAAAGGISSRNHPSKHARVGRERLRRCELGKHRASQQALVRVAAAVENHLTESREIRCSCKHSRVPSYAAHGERIFVVNFSTYLAFAIRCVLLSGSNSGEEGFRWIEL